jgi:hypothetical protein
MINKDFTLYPEALELKQLGFDEPCFAWYHLGDTLLSDITMGYEKTDFLYTQDDMEETQCTAPTYSQAFRWFRDNGKVAEIFSQLLPSNKYKWGFKIQGVEGVTDGFFTYEEAELACLKKLIEIAKALNI